MNKTKRIAGYCRAGAGEGAFKPFDKIFDEAVCLNDKDAPDIAKVDALILWGGEDISPTLYNQKPSRAHAGEIPSYRDKFEWEMMRQAVLNKVPIIGVCRGAQIATCFAGGSLIQHVDGHNSGHDITTIEGNTFPSNSIHHQMMNPYNLPTTDYQLLAWATNPQSKTYVGEGHQQVFLDNGQLFAEMFEPEIVYYKKINALCIQGHPEWMPATSRFVEYCLEKVNELLFKSSACGQECPV